jgi:CBS domain-containing protein
MYAGDIKRDDEGRVVVTESVGDLFDTIVAAAATVPIDATLKDAVDAILGSGVTRKAYVIDPEGRLLGAITMETLMRHLASRLGARPPGVISWFRFVRDMESDRVADFMSRPVAVTRDATVGDIMRKVVEEHLNDFPVVDDASHLLGEVNTYKLLRAARAAFSTPSGGEGPVP